MNSVFEEHFILIKLRKKVRISEMRIEKEAPGAWCSTYTTLSYPAIQ